MKLGSAGSLKGSNLLIKDRDWFVTGEEKKAHSASEKLQPALHNTVKLAGTLSLSERTGARPAMTRATTSLRSAESSLMLTRD